MSQNKPAAVLTNAQREYLQGKKDYRPSVERQVRKRIRDRVEQGTADFTTLLNYLDGKEVQQIFGSASAKKIEKHQEARGDVPTDRKTAASVPVAIAFFMKGLDDSDAPIYEAIEDMPEGQPAFKRFRRALEQAIGMYIKQEKNYIADVSVNIELNDLQPADELFDESTDE